MGAPGRMPVIVNITDSKKDNTVPNYFKQVKDQISSELGLDTVSSAKPTAPLPAFPLPTSPAVPTPVVSPSVVSPPAIPPTVVPLPGFMKPSEGEKKEAPRTDSESSFTHLSPMTPTSPIFIASAGNPPVVPLVPTKYYKKYFFLDY
jgi:hypothetical protein